MKTALSAILLVVAMSAANAGEFHVPKIEVVTTLPAAHRVCAHQKTPFKTGLVIFGATDART